MNTDLIFKSILVISFLLMIIPRAIYIERQEQLTIVDERHPEREDRLSIAGATLWYIPLALYLFTPWLEPFQLPFPIELRLAGAIILLVGGNYLFLKVHEALGENWSPTLQVRQGHTLAVNGPYRYIRHPMYTAYYLMAVGMFLVSGNWLLGLTRLASSILLQVVRLSDEEQMMLDVFGDEYRQYQQRTGAFLPKLFS